MATVNNFLTDGNSGFRDLDPPERMEKEPNPFKNDASSTFVSPEFIIENNIDDPKLNMMLYKQSIKSRLPWWANTDE